ncbi:tRNA (5-methylaminomethyl-2-thiouridine)(34)-methyltransferase MnmD [Cognatishimia sp. MH4019]|uniref:tRNA (5-methylaminomethyl-2-thiouridine)(34)-methyltransferase MnmD n=1 Tax=Cognatishimia sp. MH4019 TaxID=2854030 RepID=UPI001CD67631|nr:tRNA (5-methylaminomethyl-2-thiouridine)(34)-methyltransferase MnmD [Cognatishimia sp. MH4019]
MGHQRADLEWRDGDVPVSTRFQDPYFSLENGLDETRHVFLVGNDLPARFCEGFHIAELGFGTGLNMLAALIAWRASGTSGPLRFTSFEAYPMTADEVARALRAFPKALAIAEPFLAAWGDGQTEIVTEDLYATVVIGDAGSELSNWDAQADAWFLDGFSPNRNPDMWHSDLLGQVGKHTKPGGTAATYTAAGFVRRGLQDAGFEVTRTEGYGRKRHMTRARKPA